MKVYVSHSSASDYEQELYEPIRQASWFEEHEIFLPHETANLDTNAHEIIKNSDLLIAEVSFASTGQGIEIGRASAANVPIACFYKNGSRTSSSLRFVTDKIVPYRDTDEMMRLIEALL